MMVFSSLNKEDRYLTIMPSINSYLTDILVAQKRGQAQGIYANCSANQFVIEAGVKHALRDGSVLLVESTSNQVDQYGGYIGMTPRQFAQYVRGIALSLGLSPERIILGGDHLGPNVWQNEPAASAMAKARVLVQECVLAGYGKIHLDASMKCGDDAPDTPLAKTTIAERAADLCLAAEQAYHQVKSLFPKPVYVIGSEVPPPGGAHAKEARISVTKLEDAEEIITITKNAFTKRGLEAAWKRVIALVVQPGVEFGNDFVLEYDPVQASALSGFIKSYERLVFEAHSTDYQRREALRKMVADHFAILKVGPALTFAFREAVFALALMEKEWLVVKSSVSLSNIIETLDSVMLDNPVHWKEHYTGTEEYLCYARRYSYSDRARYYWSMPELQKAMEILLNNLEKNPVPIMLLSQFMPVQYERVREGLLGLSPRELIHDKIASVLADYAYACGMGGAV